MNFLDQCTAVITGASSGLGAEFARQLAPVASTLILVARRKDRLEALAAELHRPGLAIHIRAADLANRGEVDALIDWIASTGEPVDFLINNAGLGDHGRFDTSDWGRVQQMIDVNVGALTRLTHGLLPILKQRQRAAILNVSSIAAFMPVPKLAIYAATKAYVSSFTEALRAELRETEIRVTALCPGPTPTEFGSVAQRGNEPDTLTYPEFFRVSVPEVVRQGLAAVEGDRPRVIPGWLVALFVLLTALVPMVLMRPGLNVRGKGQ